MILVCKNIIFRTLSLSADLFTTIVIWINNIELPINTCFFLKKTFQKTLLNFEFGSITFLEPTDLLESTDPKIVISETTDNE